MEKIYHTETANPAESSFEPGQLRERIRSARSALRTVLVVPPSTFFYTLRGIDPPSKRG
ncbi:MAG: hypothetical protein IPN83_22920 [Holophagales bacterium]|nr:hypothetical protein [Holophagales bacterium]